MIINLIFQVIESSESLCLTLAVKKVMSKLCLDKTTNEVGTIHSPAVPLTWKLRWFSEESLFKFLSLFKALHDSVTSAPLVVVHKMWIPFVCFIFSYVQMVVIICISVLVRSVVLSYFFILLYLVGYSNTVNSFELHLPHCSLNLFSGDDHFSK